jgi:type I restriction enzyme S subunit
MGNKWPTLPLEELVENIFDRRGVTPTKLGSDFISAGNRVISAKLIKGSRIDLSADEPRFVNAVTYKKWMSSPLQEDDVIMTSEAPLGELAWVRQKLEWCLGQRLFGIRTDKQKLDGRFLFYALQSETVRNDLISRATGTTVTGIRQSELRKVAIPLPPLPEQKRIAGILGALDDKIELNRKMNETLEQMAMTLFKSWFVDFDPVHAKAAGRQPAGMDKATADLFPDSLVDSEMGKIPKGWRVGKLGDIGFNPRRGVQPEDISADTPYIGLEHMPRRCIALGEWANSNEAGSGKSEFKKGEILFGKLRPYFHKVGVAPFDGICSTDILVLSPRSPEWFGLLLCHASSDELIRFVDQASTGTKMPRTNWGDISSFKAAIPPESIADKLTSSIVTKVNYIHENLRQSRTLSLLRDSLLPKLLSGESAI